MNVWVAEGLCTLSGYCMFLVICSTEDRRSCSVSGGRCCCLCYSRNPKMGWFVPGLQGLFLVFQLSVLTASPVKSEGFLPLVALLLQEREPEF